MVQQRNIRTIMASSIAEEMDFECIMEVIDLRMGAWRTANTFYRRAAHGRDMQSSSDRRLPTRGSSKISASILRGLLSSMKSASPLSPSSWPSTSVRVRAARQPRAKFLRPAALESWIFVPKLFFVSIHFCRLISLEVPRGFWHNPVRGIIEKGHPSIRVTSFPISRCSSNFITYSRSS